MKVAIYARYSGLAIVQSLFYGIAPAVMAIITIAAVKLVRMTDGHAASLPTLRSALRSRPRVGSTPLLMQAEMYAALVPKQLTRAEAARSQRTAGSGAAGIGIARLLRLAMLDEGIAEADARRALVLVDSRGQIHDRREHLDETKHEFALTAGAFAGYHATASGRSCATAALARYHVAARGRERATHNAAEPTAERACCQAGSTGRPRRADGDEEHPLSPVDD